MPAYQFCQMVLAQWVSIDSQENWSAIWQNFGLEVTTAL